MPSLETLRGEVLGWGGDLETKKWRFTTLNAFCCRREIRSGFLPISVTFSSKAFWITTSRDSILWGRWGLGGTGWTGQIQDRWAMVALLLLALSCVVFSYYLLFTKGQKQSTQYCVKRNIEGDTCTTQAGLHLCAEPGWPLSGCLSHRGKGAVGRATSSPPTGGGTNCSDLHHTQRKHIQIDWSFMTSIYCNSLR